MLKRLILAAVAAAGLATSASAQQAQWPGVTLYDYKGTPVGTTTNPLYVSGGGGGGGGSGPYYVGQYNSTLPTFASGTTNYLSMDANGRLIIAPSSSVSVSNFPASQPVTNAGTFAVQNTAPVVGGNTAAVKTDGSATTQPVSAASLPLPAGAATAANQNVTAAGTSAANAQAVQGVTGGVPQSVSNGGTFAVQNTAAIPAGTNTIGTVNLPTTANAPTTAQVTINTTGAVILASGRSDIMVQITNSSTTQGVFIGPTGITPTTGHYLAPGASFTMDTKVSEGQWVAVTAANTAVLTILRF